MSIEIRYNTREATWDDWPAHARKRWDTFVGLWPAEDRENLRYVNYFSPRPYRNEYDRGSSDEGFVYRLANPARVCIRYIQEDKAGPYNRNTGVYLQNGGQNDAEAEL